MKRSMQKSVWLLASVALIAVLCLSIISFSLPYRTALAYDSYYETDADRWPEGTFTELTYGLYWYDNESEIPKKQGDPNANFDPSKPTIIFTHGMKLDEGYHSRDLLSLHGATDGQFTSKGYKTYADESGYDVQYYRTLLKDYNVGQFYWSQLAEEFVEGDVKIWTADSDFEERYVVYDPLRPNAKTPYRSVEKYVNQPDQPVGVLYGNAIIDALPSDYDQPLRIAGHSMGGQLSLAASQYLVKMYQKGAITNKRLVPERVSLIDPYLSMTNFDEWWGEEVMIDSTGKEIPDGAYTIELAAQAMDDITEFGIAVDAYGGMEMVYRLYNMETSDKTVDEEELAALQAWANDITDRLTRNATWTYLSSLANGSQGGFGAMSHTILIDYYFTTMYEPTAYDNWGRELPSFYMSTADVLSYRGVHFRQSVKEAGLNPFWQHNSNYTQCDAFYNTVTDTLQGTTDDKTASSAYLLDMQGNELKQAAVEDGKYTFAISAKGTYAVRLVDQAGEEIETQYYYANGNKEIAECVLLDGATKNSRAYKALLLEGDGVAQECEIEEGKFRFALGEAALYGVRLVDQEGAEVGVQVYELDKDGQVTLLAETVKMEGSTDKEKAATAKLLDVNGTVLETVEIVDGKYSFSLAAGDYSVLIVDAEDKDLETKTYTVASDYQVKDTTKDTQGLKAGQIFLAVILSLIGAVLVVVGILYIVKTRKKKKKPSRPDYSREN